MATDTLFVEDAYRKSCGATVVEAGNGKVVLDRTVFYPVGGGQPGDTGTLAWGGGAVGVADTRKGAGGTIEHVLEDGAEPPAAGTQVAATIDWDRRYRHMRMHTAMHLLSTVVPYGVTGGSISAVSQYLGMSSCPFFCSGRSYIVPSCSFVRKKSASPWTPSRAV